MKDVPHPTHLLHLYQHCFLTDKTKEQKDPSAKVESSKEAKDQLCDRVRMTVGEVLMDKEVEAFKNPGYSKYKQHF